MFFKDLTAGAEFIVIKTNNGAMAISPKYVKLKDSVFPAAFVRQITSLSIHDAKSMIENLPDYNAYCKSNGQLYSFPENAEIFPLS